MTMDVQRTATETQPSFGDLLAAFGKIGVLSFGGPAGQIAMMHRVLVDDRKWIDEKRYLTALNFCMLLPGPEAMQLATYTGWRLHGIAGGLAAGTLFVLPGACVMLVLGLIYALYGQVPFIASVFFGIKAAVLAIVVEALLRVARRALKTWADWLTAAAAFFAIAGFGVPFPVIVASAALIGWWRSRNVTPEAASSKIDPAAAQSLHADSVTALRTAALWLAIWLVPLITMSVLLGPAHVLSQLAWFFSKLAVVTFGGAYAVLAYMAQDVVEHYHWLRPGEMLDGLGLAETTPGPLILVTQFTGMIAAFRHGGGPPVAMALAGAAVTLWATFVPCFLWVFTGAPFIERLTKLPRLAAALASVTACVTGVILNLTVWFALQVLFTRVDAHVFGPLRVLVPDPTSLDARTAVIAALAFAMLFAFHRGILTTIAACAALSLVFSYALA